MPGDWRSFCSRWRRRRLSFCKERATGKRARHLWAAGVKALARVQTTAPVRRHLGPVLSAPPEWKRSAKSTESSDDGGPLCAIFRFATEPAVAGKAAGLSRLHSGTPPTGGGERQADGCDSGLAAQFAGDGARADRRRQDNLEGESRTDPYPEFGLRPPDGSRSDSSRERGGGSPRVGQFQLAGSVQADSVADEGAPGRVQASPASRSE